jgi:hypothetical protein
LLIAGTGLAIVAATSSVDGGYWPFAVGIVVQALGMGITTAPSTGAIMRSLPLHKAGVGSAVNDTTRELGGALGVAVLGSLVASHFRSTMQSVRGLPDQATHSLAAVLQHAHSVGGPPGDAIAHTARSAFVDAFAATLWIAVAVAVVASGLVTWLLRSEATRGVEVNVDEYAPAVLEAT